MKTFTAFFATVLLTMVLCACQAENEYSSSPCRFAYDNSVHQNAALASAMVPDSRGVFCKITEST